MVAVLRNRSDELNARDTFPVDQQKIVTLRQYWADVRLRSLVQGPHT